MEEDLEVVSAGDAEVCCKFSLGGGPLYNVIVPKDLGFVAIVTIAEDSMKLFSDVARLGSWSEITV